eukprot:8693-Heterococcus_DN1.PRE.1
MSYWLCLCGCVRATSCILSVCEIRVLALALHGTIRTATNTKQPVKTDNKHSAESFIGVYYSAFAQVVVVVEVAAVAAVVAVAALGKRVQLQVQPAAAAVVVVAVVVVATAAADYSYCCYSLTHNRTAQHITIGSAVPNTQLHSLPSLSLIRRKGKHKYATVAPLPHRRLQLRCCSSGAVNAAATTTTTVPATTAAAAAAKHSQCAVTTTTGVGLE